eukprot:CAMPEP_0195523686 /NCGR_PEP_ID=MMETSP0794_2-20130614/23027_1 /TAXON_ID=515487 /ORGANISM="Stephanopyxis turris, Strain CCMP 815" /LENGTH=404 /DNA_ID=CAMNT_0040653737 /DNA_START=78 /DNA_END=1292 /DNA_ORIENTATION=+
MNCICQCTASKRNVGTTSKFLTGRVVLIVLSYIFCHKVSAFSCLDEHENPVDHWVAITAPSKLATYYFYDNTTYLFHRSKFNVTQALQGMIMSTVNQIYNIDNMSEVAYGLYNDQPPPPTTNPSNSYAHAKGVLITNRQKGFFLVHSRPHWPQRVHYGPTPFPDTKYGQSLLCVTISVSTANEIANNLMVAHPDVYDGIVGDAIKDRVPAFENFISNRKSTEKGTIKYEFQSWDGSTFVQFAKSNHVLKDFWDDIVAPFYNSSMNVESWRNGAGGRMGSICTPKNGLDGKKEKGRVYDIHEVTGVTMPDGTFWEGTDDHSKWGIGKPLPSSNCSDGRPALPYCIGDLNRMCSQERRGGGSICRKDSNVHSAFSHIVAGTEDCWKYNPCDTTYHSCYWCENEVSN